MIAYLTFAESPSGIYSSQVIDTCFYLSKLSKKKIKLVAIISSRNFFSNRKIIKLQYGNSIVLPMFPKLSNWSFNIILLCLVFFFIRPNSIICRNSFGTVLALRLKNLKLVRKVIYDGRGCEYEQIKEYKVISDDALAEEILENEKKSSNESDFQMAVSDELINYWKKKFNYSKTTNIVIPCSLNSSFENKINPMITRKSLGISEEDIVLIYSGSVSGWQSFQLLFDFIEMHIKADKAIRILLLTKSTTEIEKFVSKYPGKISLVWSEEKDVNSYLSLADYGLLLREKALTNWVASPVKFAEYLLAGIDIIVNANSIEQSEQFIRKYDCGLIYREGIIQLPKLTSEKRKKNSELALSLFSKNSDNMKKMYEIIIEKC